MTLILVIAGGAAGALIRHAASSLNRNRLGHRQLPWGTLLVNIAGSFGLGLLAGWAVPPWLWSLGAVGFAGALTTYSTLALESVELVTRRSSWAAAGYVATTLLLGLLSAATGWWLAR